jgi:hypothetical protein
MAYSDRSKIRTFSISRMCEYVNKIVPWPVQERSTRRSDADYFVKYRRFSDVEFATAKRCLLVGRIFPGLFALV